jgi:hypothetical protein
MRYYLKLCGHQELGSVTNGKTQRGRYLLTSKKALDFFPPLSTTQLNDSALLPIVPLYSGKKVYCSYVYHNNEYHGSTASHPRNEYRIYLNNQLENDSLLFEKGDIVIIRPEEIFEDEERQTIFWLDLVKDRSLPLYNKLSTIISQSPIKGGYGIVEHDIIAEFEEKIETLRKTTEPTIAIDNAVTEQIKKSGSETVAGLFSAVSFRDFVMVGYEAKCAVTGMVICYESYMNLEAAHIKPKSHGGLYLPNNGIALCRDMHWAFDKGFFTLSRDYKVRVHPETTSEWLCSFIGKRIFLPADPFFRPAIENIEYHNDNIFGRFLISGRL